MATNDGRVKRQRQQTTEATNHGGNLIERRRVANKNVRFESTICEYDGQTPSSTQQTKKFHKKANFFMLRKDVSKEMGEPHDITVYNDGL